MRRAIQGEAAGKAMSSVASCVNIHQNIKKLAVQLFSNCGGQHTLYSY